MVMLASVSAPAAALTGRRAQRLRPEPVVSVVAHSIQLRAVAAHRPNGLIFGIGRNEPVLDREHSRARARVEVDLVVHACQVVLHGAG